MAKLRSDASTIFSHCKEVAEHVSPQHGLFLCEADTEQTEGEKLQGKIINSTPTDAFEIMASGLKAGTMSPSMPWFALSHEDEELMEYSPVRNWLHDVRNIMLSHLSKSNYYSAGDSVFAELTLFGTSAIAAMSDMTRLYFQPFVMGEYFLTRDANGKIVGLHRRFRLTARELVGAFGKENLSVSVTNALNGGNTEAQFVICHHIIPNDEIDYSKLDFRGQPYLSIYYEEAGDEDKILSKKGFKTKPFAAPRYDVVGRNTWGRSRGMGALPDCKMLQTMEQKKLKALAKMVDPTMNAPSSMRGKGGTLVAGGINYVDAAAGGQSFSPAYMVNPDLQNIAYELDRVETRIKKRFGNDLFLALLNEDKRMTATEVAKRYEEKLIMLGPALNRIQDEYLAPMVDRCFELLLNMGVFPQPPKEIEGANLKVEFTSVLAQAQKMVGVGTIEQLLSFAGNIAGVNPQVLDKIDFDEAIDQFSTAIGSPPKIVKSDDVVAGIREQRVAQQEAAQRQEMAAQMAQGAELMSRTKLNTGSALDRLMGNT